MKNNYIRVAILSELDPNDKRSWSGIIYCMAKSLEQEFEHVSYLGPVKLTKKKRKVMRYKQLFYIAIHRLLTKRKYNGINCGIKSSYHGKFFDAKIQENKVDVIFAPISAPQIAKLKSTVPICYYSDTTYQTIVNYYQKYSNFSQFSNRIAHSLEQKAFDKAISHAFSSQWACNSAKENYNVTNPQLVKMGANIDREPTENELEKNYDNCIKILFVGVEWERKGGDIAIDTIDKLNKNGFNVELTVIGCTPPIKHKKMKVVPFLDKNKKQDMDTFRDHFVQAHLFFMPTRAECYGIVFCEANAYGLPVITTNTGGTSSVVENGVNGYILPLSATSSNYYKVISELLYNKTKLKQLAVTSRTKYLNELNWQQWGKKIRKIIEHTYFSKQ
ncbi:glycosyltransferase family 4 protein [Saccharicrinis aurantiacus]|uniref:glycosyltransferase family 4 protein n=1 Tax=Saccharicrinis aurantiacus TaxID=1849719 RepID=UPI00094FE7C1|nr:glycosyltransferase family 4 protein [Saccharicrinis aurantiacus]